MILTSLAGRPSILQPQVLCVQPGEDHNLVSLGNSRLFVKENLAVEIELFEPGDVQPRQSIDGHSHSGVKLGSATVRLDSGSGLNLFTITADLQGAQTKLHSAANVLGQVSLRVQTNVDSKTSDYAEQISSQVKVPRRGLSRLRTLAGQFYRKHDNESDLFDINEANASANYPQRGKLIAREEYLPAFSYGTVFVLRNMSDCTLTLVEEMPPVMAADQGASSHWLPTFAPPVCIQPSQTVAFGTRDNGPQDRMVATLVYAVEGQEGVVECKLSRSSKNRCTDGSAT